MQSTSFVLAAIALFLSLTSCSTNAVEHENIAFDVSPDGERIAFSAADGDLYLFELATKRVQRITETAAVESYPAFSPDGTRLAYSSIAKGGEASAIYTCDLEGKQVQPIANDASFADIQPSFSSDGSRIVFARAHQLRPYSMGGTTWDKWDVYVANADGSQLNRISQGNYRGIHGLAFSNDDDQVYFSTESRRVPNDLATNIFVVPTDASAEPQPLTSIPKTSQGASWGSEPSMSFDGTKLIIISDRAEQYQYDLVIIQPNGREVHKLGATSVSRYNTNPRFSADGEKVFFLAGTEWNAGSRPIFSLWSIDTNGKNSKELADSSLFTNPTGWIRQAKN